MLDALPYILYYGSHYGWAAIVAILIIRLIWKAGK